MNIPKYKTNGRRLLFLFATVAILVIVTVIYLNQPKFGRAICGERLAKIEKSPNYKDGKFRNIELTPHLTSDKSMVRAMFDYVFGKNDYVRSDKALPCIKTELSSLDKKSDLIVWFGHSSYFIQCSGKQILIDPVFGYASPVSFFNKPFKGTDIYQASDMPDIDYLIITHDHWDHLDYETVVEIRNRVNKVVCLLGVGDYFEYWGYTPQQIIEMDWNEQHSDDNNFTFHCLPTRHFSGRSFRSCTTLWAGYMIETPSQTIYVSGDGGYGKHFTDIAHKFPQIDVAIIENGQYNEDWLHLHLTPKEMRKVVEILQPKKIFAGHNSKYALSRHPWSEPLDEAATIPGVTLPLIGEAVHLQDSATNTNRWWMPIND